MLSMSFTDYATKLRGPGLATLVMAIALDAALRRR
jgi:hypothetical protein